MKFNPNIWIICYFFLSRNNLLALYFLSRIIYFSHSSSSGKRTIMFLFWGAVLTSKACSGGIWFPFSLTIPVKRKQYLNLSSFGLSIQHWGLLEGSFWLASLELFPDAYLCSALNSVLALQEGNSCRIYHLFPTSVPQSEFVPEMQLCPKYQVPACS